MVCSEGPAGLVSLRFQLTSLTREFDAEDNAAFDLWTWLPSYKAAQQHHEDHAGDFKPSNADVMIEAAQHFAAIKNVNNTTACPCPCGEEHE